MTRDFTSTTQIVAHSTIAHAAIKATRHLLEMGYEFGPDAIVDDELGIVHNILALTNEHAPHAYDCCEAVKRVTMDVPELVANWFDLDEQTVIDCIDFADHIG